MTDGMKRPEGAGLWDYLKEAFLFRWNLLALVGAITPSTAPVPSFSGSRDVIFANP